MCQGIGYLDPEKLTCTCIGGAEPNDEGVCSCGDKSVNVAMNGCVVECPANSVDRDGICECNPGYGIEGDSCVKCKNGFVPDIDGKCSLCPVGNVADLGNVECITTEACQAIVGAEVAGKQC